MRRAARPVGSPPCIMNLQRQQHRLPLQPGAYSSYNILRRQQSCKHCRRNGFGSNGVVRPCMAFVSITMVQLKALYEGSPSNVSVKDGIVIVSACAQC